MRRASWVGLVLAMLVLAWSGGPASAQGERPSVQRVTLDFHRAPMAEVIQYFSTLLGENFIIAGELDAAQPLTVIAPRPVSVREARSVLETALHAQGLTLVRVGEFWKVVSASDATPSLLDGGGRLEEARARTVVLQHVSPRTLAPILEKLGGPHVKIVAWEPTGTLIIVAPRREQERLLEVVEALDRSGEASTVHVHGLEHADAEDVAEVLRGVVE